MRYHRTIAAALLGILLAPAFGCSGDDDSADEAENDEASETSGEGPSSTSGESYVAAFTASLDNVYATPENLACMGETTVDVVGVEAFEAAGTLDELEASGGVLQTFGIQLDEATAGALVDALEACVDLRTLVFGDDEVRTPDEQACLEDRIPDDVFRTYMISTYTSADGQPGAPELETVSTAFTDCTA